MEQKKESANQHFPSESAQCDFRNVAGDGGGGGEQGKHGQAHVEVIVTKIATVPEMASLAVTGTVSSPM